MAIRLNELEARWASRSVHEGASEEGCCGQSTPVHLARTGAELDLCVLLAATLLSLREKGFFECLLAGICPTQLPSTVSAALALWLGRRAVACKIVFTVIRSIKIGVVVVVVAVAVVIILVLLIVNSFRSLLELDLD